MSNWILQTSLQGGACCAHLTLGEEAPKKVQRLTWREPLWDRNLKCLSVGFHDIQRPPPAPCPQDAGLATRCVPKPQRLFCTGERLFPLVYNVHAHLAGKITGMLLEIDNSELLLMLESPESLNAKVRWSLGAVGRPEGGGGLQSQVSAAGTEEGGFLAGGGDGGEPGKGPAASAPPTLCSSSGRAVLEGAVFRPSLGEGYPRCLARVEGGLRGFLSWELVSSQMTALQQCWGGRGGEAVSGPCWGCCTAPPHVPHRSKRLWQCCRPTRPRSTCEE